MGKTISLIFPLFPKFGAALKLLYIELFPLHWMWLPCSEHMLSQGKI
jgi:hypothetical protein